MQFNTSVSITVPSTVNVDGAMSNEGVLQRVQEVAQFFAAKFGGATAQRAEGFYVADDGALIAESVVVVSAYVAGDNDRLPYLDNFMRNIAQNYCKEWSQECVLYTVGGIANLAFGE
jgi:hypothetical protein